jgi:hypothetical protein
MTMSRIFALNLRFHNVVAAALLGIVLLFTALILIAVIGRFNSMAEDNAKERFSLIAQTGVERLRNLVGGTGRQVMVQAGARRERFVAGRRLNDRDMVVSFMSQLEGEESLYSVYFGLDNDDFFQVVNARANPRLLASLGAPEQTRFALRKIVGAKEAAREETWQFWSADRQILGSLRTATSYLPTRRPWYDAAKKKPPLAITEPYLFASSGEPGITISSPLRGGAGVLGADLSLGALRDFLAKIPLTPASAIVVLDRSNRILALHSASTAYGLAGVAALTPLFRTTNPHLAVLTGWENGVDGAKARVVDVGG